MRRFAAVMSAIALLLVGCGSNGGDASSSSAPAPTSTSWTSTPNPTPSSSPEDGPTTSVSPTPPPIATGGANAAPTEPVRSFYDNSQRAATDFGAWWRYELQVRDDELRGVQQAYVDGIAVCEIRATGKSPDTAVATLKQMGWTEGGGAAIVAAAVRTLCPHYDFGTASSDGTIMGWKTYFDEQVNLSYPLVLRAMVPFNLRNQPTHIDVGWFGKYTCTYLQSTNTSIGLLDYLMNQGKGLALSETRPLAQAAVKAVVTHMCPGYMDKVFTW